MEIFWRSSFYPLEMSFQPVFWLYLLGVMGWFTLDPTQAPQTCEGASSWAHGLENSWKFEGSTWEGQSLERAGTSAGYKGIKSTRQSCHFVKGQLCSLEISCSPWRTRGATWRLITPCSSEMLRHDFSDCRNPSPPPLMMSCKVDGVSLYRQPLLARVNNPTGVCKSAQLWKPLGVSRCTKEEIDAHLS